MDSSTPAPTLISTTSVRLDVPPLNTSPEESEDELLAGQLNALDFSDRDGSDYDMDDDIGGPFVGGEAQHVQSSTSSSALLRNQLSLSLSLADAKRERRERQRQRGERDDTGPILVPDTPYEPSVAKVVEKLRQGRADRNALAYIVNEVWPGGTITLEGLQAPMGEAELCVFGLSTGSARFQGLFRVQGGLGYCLLCAHGGNLEFTTLMDGLMHLTMVHFDMGYRCRCGCKEIYWTSSDFKRHLRRIQIQAAES